MNRARKAIVVVILLFCPLLFGGCSSAQPKMALIKGNQISNPTIGYHGYRVHFPEGFSVVSPDDLPTEDDHPLVATAKAHFAVYQPPWMSKVSWQFREYYLAVSTNQAMSFGVATIRTKYPLSMIKERQMEEILRQIAVQHPDLRRGTLKSRGTTKYVHLSEIGNIEGYPEPVALEKLMLFGNLNELFFFSGVAPKEQHDEFHQRIEQVFANFEF